MPASDSSSPERYQNSEGYNKVSDLSRRSENDDRYNYSSQNFTSEQVNGVDQERSRVDTNSEPTRDDYSEADKSFPGSKCKKVGQYLLGPTIGEGSYGKIRLATHLISKQQVAMKVVAKKTLVQREVARRHFRREALLLQQVLHPNIVKLYEAMETTNSYYLVFELATGGSMLDHVTQRGSLSEDECRHYMRQIVSAVDHLHRSNIVHRDVKLENFLLNGVNHIKLVDFGLSAMCRDSQHHLSTLCGSPVYAAPELFAGRKYGKPVDIWGIGVCFYAMLTGKLPFLPEDKTSLPQLYSLILKGFIVPTGVSQECQHLLSRMLELQEGRRITAEELLSHGWLTHPDGQAVRRVPMVSKKFHENSINMTIVKYMCTVYRYSESDVIGSVLERKLTAAAATYNILKDAIEKGHITIIIPNSTLRKDSGTAGKRLSSTLPILDTRVESRKYSDSSGLEHSSEPSNTMCNSTTNPDIQQTTDRKLSDTYKSCILVLKRSRQQLHQSNHRVDPHNGVDCVVVGRSPRPSNCNVLACLSPHLLKGNSTPLTLPPIVTNHLALSGNLRYIRGGTNGKKHPIPLDHQEVFHLDVKGVSPSLFDRSSLTNAGTLTTNFYSFAQGYFPGRKPPPPPPPNSTFGDNSSQSEASSNRKLSQLSTSSESNRLSLRGADTFLTSQSADIDFRIPRDPIRPSLAALRDPFGRDTWRKAHHNDGLQLSKPILRKPGASATQYVDSALPGDIHGGFDKGIRWQENFTDPLDSKMDFGGAEVDNHQTKDGYDDLGVYAAGPTSGTRPKQLSPSRFLQHLTRLKRFQSVGIGGNVEPLGENDSRDADTPMSQSQEKEDLDYLTPVTRVTITTIGRH